MTPTALLTALVACSLTHAAGRESPLPPQPVGMVATAPGLAWSFSTQPGAVGMALANRGTQVLHAESLVGGGARLLSSFDANPPAGLWVAEAVGNLPNLRGAAQADVFLGATELLAGPFSTSWRLSAFDGAQGSTGWQYDFPEQAFFVTGLGFDVSHDGSVVTSVHFDPALGQVRLRVHDPVDGSVLSGHDVLAPVSTARFDLSGDGRVYALSAANGDGNLLVADVQSGASLLRVPGSLPVRQALSLDGRVVAARELEDGVAWHVRAYESVGGTYVERLHVETAASDEPEQLAVSDDGSTLVVGWRDATQPSVVRVAAYDVATGAATMERSVGDPGFENHVSALSVSADGSRFAWGIWGDGSFAPELFVQARDQVAPLFSVPGNGSVLDVQLAPDGRRMLSRRMPAHVSSGFSFSRIQLHDLGADLVISGQPLLGGALELRLFAEAGAPAALLLGLAPAAPALEVGAAGTLFLDPASLVVVGLGAVSAGGSLDLTLPVPTTAALAGLDVFVQGASLAPLALGQTWDVITPVP